MKRVISLLVVSLLLLSIFASVEIQPAEAYGTIYIRADGSIDPPEVPIQRSGDLYTLEANMNVFGIVIERDNMLFDGMGCSIEGNGTYSKAIDLSGRRNVTIRNLKIEAFRYGISASYSSNSTILQNSIHDIREHGISLVGSQNITICRNNINYTHTAVELSESYNETTTSKNSIFRNQITSSFYGITLVGSTENHIYSNIIDESSYGVYFQRSTANFVCDNVIANSLMEGSNGVWLDGSANNIVRNNSMVNFMYCWRVSGSNITDFVNYVDSSNTVDGKRVYYWLNQTDMIVPYDAGHVALVNCSNITVRGLNISKQREGVLLVCTTNSTITENALTNNYNSLFITNSSSNSICRNSISAHASGIRLEHSPNSIVSWNNVTGCRYGIYLIYSPNNEVNWNNVTECAPGRNDYAVTLSMSPNSTLCGNYIVKNGDGARVGSNIALSGNLFSENGDRGLYVSGSYNLIYNNLFIDNTNYGIDLEYYSENNLISENNITGGLAAIWIQYSDHNEVLRNNMTETASFGVWIGFSSNNTVHENYIAGSMFGVALHKSNYSFVYHNDFVNCDVPAGAINATGSVWDDGYPSGGNYWGDYEENYPDAEDIYSGLNQDLPGSDGIWDKPYVIDPLGNQDNYPLAYPFTGHYTYVTNFTLTESSSSNSTMYESVSVLSWIVQNATVSGDFNGFMNLTSVICFEIETGPFADKGIIVCSWTSKVENTDFSGRWETTQIFNASTGGFTLKGVVTGDFQGIATGTIKESVPGSEDFNTIHVVWKLNRVHSVVVSASIDINGVIEKQNSSLSSGVQFAISQMAMNGSAEGYYSGSLSAVITSVRIVDGMDGSGKGFSTISYESQLGQGEGCTVDQALAPDHIALNGMFTTPLSGVTHATFTNNDSRTRLTGTVRGLPASKAIFTLQPDLDVRIWGTSSVSPGQTAEYIITYRNKGLRTADEAIVFAIPYSGKLLSASEGVQYDECFEAISWNLGQLPPKTRGQLTFRVETPWGLPQGTTLGVPAYIINNERASVPLPECPEAKNLFINGIGLTPESPSRIKYEEFARQAKAKWVEVYNTGNRFLDAPHVQFATPGLLFNPTKYNGLTNPDIINPDCDYDTVYAYSAGTRTAVTAITHFNLRCKKLVLISPIAGYQSIGGYRDELMNCLSKGVEEIVIYQSSKDLLPGGLGGYQAKYQPQDFSDPRIKLVERPLSGDFDYCFGPGCGIKAHWELLLDVNKLLNNGSSSVAWSGVLVAIDPNAKYGLDRYVSVGQTLDYTIEYENEGEGIAFGVYITDTLDESLDASTLVINEDGTYNPSTRTITWLIGEVGPHQKGSVTFSVSVGFWIPEGTEIVNFATVHFPSVPETTRTNGVVNVVAFEHDVSALIVTPSETIVDEGEVVFINVTVENQGVHTETFNVTAYANSTSIGTKSVTLTSGNYTVIVFTWNTTDFDTGNYVIKAYAWPVLDEEDITDNTYETYTPLEIVPEFSSTLILVVFVAVTLCAVIVFRSKQKPKSKPVQIQVQCLSPERA